MNKKLKLVKNEEKSYKKFWSSKESYEAYREAEEAARNEPREDMYPELHRFNRLALPIFAIMCVVFYFLTK